MHRGSLAKLREEFTVEKVINIKPPLPKSAQSKVPKTKIVQEVIESDKSGNEEQTITNLIIDDSKCESKVVNDGCKKQGLERDGESIPPKPLPRTSRTGSMCEQVEDGGVNVPKPVARPRTNSCAPVITSVNPNVPITGGYKVLIS